MKTLVWILFLALGAGPAAASTAEITAIVAGIRDGKAVSGTGAGKGRVIRYLDGLSENETIHLPPQVTMVLNYLYSGTREEISGPAVVRIGREGSSTKEPARIRKTKLAIAPPKSFLKSEDTQQFGTIAMRSLSLQKVLLFGPKNTSVAGGSQEFRWQAFPGADRYRIRIFDSRDHLVFDAYTKESSGQRSTATLSPGESYLWIVNAYRDGHAVAKGVGQFNVLSEAQSSELERQEKAIRSEDADEGEKALHLCMLYDDYGMKERICRLLSDLRKNREDNENIATYLNAYDCGDDRR